MQRVDLGIANCRLTIAAEMPEVKSSQSMVEPTVAVRFGIQKSVNRQPKIVNREFFISQSEIHRQLKNGFGGS